MTRLFLLRLWMLFTMSGCILFNEPWDEHVHEECYYEEQQRTKVQRRPDPSP